MFKLFHFFLAKLILFLETHVFQVELVAFLLQLYFYLLCIFEEVVQLVVFLCSDYGEEAIGIQLQQLHLAEHGLEGVEAVGDDAAFP